MKKSSVSQNKEEASQWSAGKTSQCFRDAEEDEVQGRATALLAAEGGGHGTNKINKNNCIDSGGA